MKIGILEQLKYNIHFHLSHIIDNARILEDFF